MAVAVVATVFGPPVDGDEGARVLARTLGPARFGRHRGLNLVVQLGRAPSPGIVRVEDRAVGARAVVAAVVLVKGAELAGDLGDGLRAPLLLKGSWAAALGDEALAGWPHRNHLEVGRAERAPAHAAVLLGLAAPRARDLGGGLGAPELREGARAAALVDVAVVLLRNGGVLRLVALVAYAARALVTVLGRLVAPPRGDDAGGRGAPWLEEVAGAAALVDEAAKPDDAKERRKKGCYLIVEFPIEGHEIKRVEYTCGI